MKKLIKIIFNLFLVSVLASSCKKEENKIYIEKFTTPVLTHTGGDDSLVLTKLTEGAFAASFSWTNPNFEFTTGVNSQDITYTLQADTTGNGFENYAFDLTSVDNGLSISITQGQLNKWMQPMKLQVEVPHAVQLRVKASVKGSAASVYSNIIPFTITPYLDVAVPVPVDGTLWVTGNAFASGWSNPLGNPYDVSQKFTQVSETLYELTVDFVGGGNFKIIQQPGQWGNQYRPKYSSDVPFTEGDFEQRDADPGWNGPASPGRYKITVDFITGTYKVEPN